LKCPSCGKDMLEDHIKLGVKPSKVKEVPEDLELKVVTVFRCECGTEVSEREVMDYHLVGR
jgi:hypothetical protein